MKISTIKNALIKQTILSLAILSVFGGGLWYLISLDEQANLDINNLKVSADSISKQAVDLSQKYNAVNENLNLYNEIKEKRDKKILQVSKLALRDAIAASRKEHAVDSLDVKMGEIKILDSPEYKREKVVAESSVVTVGLSAVTDLDVVGIIKDLEKTFWGIKFTSLKLSPAKELDNSALIAIKDTGFSGLVSAQITFTLFGISEVKQGVNDLLNDAAQTPNSPNNEANKSPIRLRQP